LDEKFNFLRASVSGIHLMGRDAACTMEAILSRRFPSAAPARIMPAVPSVRIAHSLTMPKAFFLEGMYYRDSKGIYLSRARQGICRKN
jgi:hypothetical protein